MHAYAQGCPAPQCPLAAGGHGKRGGQGTGNPCAHAQRIHAHFALHLYLFFLMSKIDDLTIRRIKDTADIVDVVGDFVDLRKAGVNYTGLCPFHDDHHLGNFIVRQKDMSTGGNTYRCFVCDAKGGPLQFLMDQQRMTFPDAIRWLGRKYGIDTDSEPTHWTPPPPRPKPKPKPLLTFKRETVRQSLRGVEDTVFVKWLRSLPWTDDQQARIARVLRLYCVGTCPHGRDWIAFWQVSHDGVPLTAKYMRYKADGKRVKDKKPDGRPVFATDWEHAWRARQGQYDPKKYTDGRALFGAHLLRQYPEATVHIVESEKSALIMATFYGNMEKDLWLACGGLKFLKPEMMQPLIDQQRTVWLWPDRDGMADWQKVVEKYGGMDIYTGFYDTCWLPEDGMKADCADIIIRMLKEGRRMPEHTHTGDPKSTTERIATATGQGGVTSSATPDPTDPPPVRSDTLNEWLTDYPQLETVINKLMLEEINTDAREQRI